MDINDDTTPELQPIFSLLKSHSSKLYQEGYFLKLDYQNSQGKTNLNRLWNKCFARLTGTALVLWDAADVDADGNDGNVLPKFINLMDASLKTLKSLPIPLNDQDLLQNILSISTAGKIRYLLHFYSHHSLLQWVAAIRLAIYEHSALQEAYTGALIAGKGKSLNNINVIMERSRMRSGQWVRVRFGAGVPWRRCWCIVTPPDEKKYEKMQKGLKTMSDSQKSSVFPRKGDIKLYDTREDGKKQTKAQPIATITDAYSAYAVYPHSKALVDASTLLKIEGNFAIHTDRPWAAEGFVFIMPEVPPGLSGCEMLLRFLIPVWDTFGLYGRPGPLIANVLDRRSLLFAMSMSNHDHYTHLKIVDIASSIIEGDISAWTDREWRKCLQDAKVKRTEVPGACSRFSLRNTNQGMARLGFGSNGRPSIEFVDKACSPLRQEKRDNSTLKKV